MDMVNVRSYKQSYKDKSSVMPPQKKEEWLIFENTHEAVVDKRRPRLLAQLCGVKIS